MIAHTRPNKVLFILAMHVLLYAQTQASVKLVTATELVCIHSVMLSKNITMLRLNACAPAGKGGECLCSASRPARGHFRRSLHSMLPRLLESPAPTPAVGLHVKTFTAKVRLSGDGEDGARPCLVHAHVLSSHDICKLLTRCAEDAARTCCGAGKPLPASPASRRYWSTTFPPSEWPAEDVGQVHAWLLPKSASLSRPFHGRPVCLHHRAASALHCNLTSLTVRMLSCKEGLLIDVRSKGIHHPPPSSNGRNKTLSNKAPTDTCCGRLITQAVLHQACRVASIQGVNPLGPKPHRRPLRASGRPGCASPGAPGRKRSPPSGAAGAGQASPWTRRGTAGPPGSRASACQELMASSSCAGWT